MQDHMQNTSKIAGLNDFINLRWKVVDAKLLETNACTCCSAIAACAENSGHYFEMTAWKQNRIAAEAAHSQQQQLYVSWYMKKIDWLVVTFFVAHLIGKIWREFNVVIPSWQFRHFSSVYIIGYVYTSYSSAFEVYIERGSETYVAVLHLLLLHLCWECEFRCALYWWKFNFILLKLTSAYCFYYMLGMEVSFPFA